VLLDVRSGAATPDVLNAWIDDGCIVLLWTGLSDDQRETDYYSRVPELPMDLVDGLIASGVKMVGVDAGSIDGEPFAIHKALLSQGVLIAENLVGLSAIASRAESELTEFTVWALPLHLETEASPARVIAAFDSGGGVVSSLGD
jgi:kynurenine formamidase